MALDMATAQRWTRAAQRALAADLTGDLIRRGNSVLVPSTTSDGKRYRVQLDGNRVGQCDCEAGLLGKPCKHRAAVAIRLYEKATGARVVAIKAGAALAMEKYLRPN
jgi:uncharacterized Zn finger protein